VRRNPHAGFGERPGETEKEQTFHRAPGRLNNLSEAAEKTVARHPPLPARRYAAEQVTPGSGALNGLPTALPGGQVRSDRTAVRTRQRHAAIHQLLAEGRTVRAIGLELGLARNTVRRFAAPPTPRNSWSTTAPASGPAFWKPMSLTCASGGTPAAPTPPGSGGTSVAAGIPAAIRWSASSWLRCGAPPSPRPGATAVPKPRKVTAWIMTVLRSCPPGTRTGSP
jgi:hypothetical protein